MCLRRSFLRRIFAKKGRLSTATGRVGKESSGMIYGNIEGIRESLLKEMEALYDLELEENEFAPAPLCELLARYTCIINREISMYPVSYTHLFHGCVYRVLSGWQEGGRHDGRRSSGRQCVSHRG